MLFAAIQAVTETDAPAVDANSSTVLQSSAGESSFGLGLEVADGLYLADPWFLVGIPLAILLTLFARTAPERSLAVVGALPQADAGAAALPKSWRQRLGFLPAVLHVLGISVLSIALARPLRADVAQTDTSEGVDILLAVDRSGSMKLPDMERQRTRLDVVKEVVGEFSERRMTDREGAADSVGLLVFARYPELLLPFTLDVAALRGFLSQVDYARVEAEDGTAIGVALAKATAVLAKSEAKSRVVVLLTDGENNVEGIEPLEAARLAAENGIRVYTILAGRFQYRRTFFGELEAIDVELDSTELEQIAVETGGRFYRARDKGELESIYAEIEQLERTPRERERYVETLDLYPRVLLVGLGVYALAWLSWATWARRLFG